MGRVRMILIVLLLLPSARAVGQDVVLEELFAGTGRTAYVTGVFLANEAVPVLLLDYGEQDGSRRQVVFRCYGSDSTCVAGTAEIDGAEVRHSHLRLWTSPGFARPRYIVQSETVVWESGQKRRMADRIFYVEYWERPLTTRRRPGIL
jgi:hypothetical protein